jgi:large subunit ribosomal protein L19
MRNSIISSFENRFVAKEKTHPSFRPGDTIRVHYKIEETAKVEKSSKGAKAVKTNTADANVKKFRLQIFEGVCTCFKKGVMNATFTVRKIGANSVGVERIFPLHSPYVENIEILSGGKVRRARLYYLRDLSGKAARIVSRRLGKDVSMKTYDARGLEAAAAAVEAAE